MPLSSWLTYFHACDHPNGRGTNVVLWLIYNIDNLQFPCHNICEVCGIMISYISNMFSSLLQSWWRSTEYTTVSGNIAGSYSQIFSTWIHILSTVRTSNPDTKTYKRITDAQTSHIFNGYINVSAHHINPPLLYRLLPFATPRHLTWACVATPTPLSMVSPVSSHIDIYLIVPSTHQPWHL